MNSKIVSGSLAILPSWMVYLITSNINFIKYIIIGVLGFIVDFGIYYLLLHYTVLHYQAANLIAAVSGMTHNYILNYYFNFKVSDRFVARLINYYLIGALGLIVSSACLYLCIDLLHFSKILSKPLVIFIVAVFQFFLNKRITFKE
jgi:putative flippase GtrA